MLWINNINWWQKWMVGRLKRQEINAFKLIGFYSLRFLCRIQSVHQCDGKQFLNSSRTEPDRACSEPNRTEPWGNRSRFCNFLTKSDFFRFEQFEPNSDNLNRTRTGYSVQLKACYCSRNLIIVLIWQP